MISWLTVLGLGVCRAAFCSLGVHGSRHCAGTPSRHEFVACAEDDWREVRARLVADEASATARSQREYVFESPLIEEGTVLVDATNGGHCTSDIFYHKSVMLLLKHVQGKDGFTYGLMLNRPSALMLDGWRLWFGGPVDEGGLFDMPRHPTDIEGERNRAVLCLHSLGRGGDDGRSESAAAAAETFSKPVVPGIWYTTLEAAQLLVDRGAACKGDFCCFVGYVGWAPSQLRGEVESGAWLLASADSRTIRELLACATAFDPPPYSEGDDDDDAEGATLSCILSWERLVRSIGREELIELPLSGRRAAADADRALAEWGRAKLLPPRPEV